MATDLHGRDQFARAYQHLSESLAAGAYRPGERLRIAPIATQLNVSQTPVREALSRLVGRGLVEDRRGNGYYLPRLDAGEISELYALNLIYLEAALGRAQSSAIFGRPASGALPAISDPAQWDDDRNRIAQLFALIVRGSENRLLAEAAGAIDMRLRPLFGHEVRLFGDLHYERDALATSISSGDRKSLLRAIRAFHRRRERAATSLAASLVRDDPTSRI